MPVNIAPAPAGEPLSALYTLAIDGQRVPVYPCRVSAVPFNTVWPGHQRPLDQTELAAFATWSQVGPVAVDVEVAGTIANVKIVPAKLAITPKVDGQHVRFTLERGVPIVVAVNGWHNALHLFADVPETDTPSPETPRVRYFGPGVHQAGPLQMHSGETIYLAEGAVVYGEIYGDNVHDVRILGRGILDSSQISREKGHGAIQFVGSHNVVIDGVTLRDPNLYGVSFYGCRDAVIRRVKEIGFWRYNTDGIDLCNCQNFVVEDCFVRTFDDSLVVKGLRFFEFIQGLGPRNYDAQPCENLTFWRNTIWCDWGRAMEIGAETCAPYYNKILFADSDIIRATHVALDLQQGDRAYVHHVTFDDIRIDLSAPNPTPIYQENDAMTYAPPSDDYVPPLAAIVIAHTAYSKDANAGKTSDIVFRNLDVTAPVVPSSAFIGADAEHDIRRVAVQNWTFNGRKLTSVDQLGIACNQFAQKPTYTP